MAGRPNAALTAARAWRRRILSMTGVSAAVHVVLLAAVVVLAERGAARSLPLAAYTVEITDPSALGGRQPPGPVTGDLSGGPTRPAAAQPKGAAPEPAPEPPKPKAPEPPPAPKEAPKPAEPPKVVEPKSAEPAVALEKKPEPEKAPEVAKPVQPKPEPKPETAKKPVAAKPEPEAGRSGGPAPPQPPERKPGEPAGSPAGGGSEPADAYAALAERWRRKQGGGLGGRDEAASGPVGSGGGDGRGGGQLVGLEFLAYKQRVEGAVKERWANVIARPGLVAIVRFEIGADGAVTGVRIVQPSGNAAYDASALRAVQLASPLPPPPARYVEQFREFQMEFHSEDQGGREAG